MEKILVTGGAGYIGSHTAIELLSQGRYEVISVDNFLNSTPKSLDRIRQISGKPIRNYNLDLCDKKGVRKVFEENPEITGIIHFAALMEVEESVRQPLRYYHNNFESLLNILDSCAEFGVKNFIFSSSCSVYGNIDKLPVTEESPTRAAVSPYGNTKLVGERIIRDFVHVADIQAIALRYFNPAGAHPSGLNGKAYVGKPSHLFPVIARVATGEIPVFTVYGSDYDTRDGSCVRDYIHVTDIARAHILALDYLAEGRNMKKYELFNLGLGEGVSVVEALKAFEESTGIKLNYRMGERRPGDAAAIYSDSSRARKLLGWNPELTIADMALSEWKWMQTLRGE
jgi:UDP-glucose 4-epimerase